MNFKVDENLPNEVAQLLSDAGHSVSTVLDEGLGGASDDAVINAAREEAHILVALDAGFTDIRRYPPSEYPGLIVLRLRRLDKPHLLDVLRRAIGRLSAEPIAAKLWVVEEGRVRIRS